MKMEHAAVYVSDLEKAKEFYIRYFGAQANDRYVNESKGFSSYFLCFDDGSRLEIMNRTDVNNRPLKTCLGFAHIAFRVGSRENVLELTERLQKDGYEVASGPRTTGDGYFESCILDMDGNMIEITI